MDTQSEVRKFLNELKTWREESQTQFSNIIHSYTGTIGKGIGELVDEVCDLKAQLSASTKDRNDLIQTINNMSSEISKLSAELSMTQAMQKHEDTQNRLTREVEDIDIQEQDAEGSKNGEGCEAHIHNATNDGDVLNYSSSHEEFNDQMVTPVAEVTEKKVYETDQKPNEENTCTKCNFAFSTSENLGIHMTHVHPNWEISEVSPANHEESRNQTDDSVEEMQDIKASQFQGQQGRENKYQKLRCKHCPYET